MAFSDLPQVLQDMYIIDYQQDMKYIILIGFFIYSLVYIFYWNDKGKQTKYIFVSSLRLLLYVCCYFYSLIFPLVLIYLGHPAVNLDIMIKDLFIICGVLMILYNILFIFNGSVILLEWLVSKGKLIPESDEYKVFNYHLKRLKWKGLRK